MMRKLLLFALLGLLAVSCSDDDPTIIEQDINGVWQAQEILGFTRPDDMPKYIRFEANTYYSSDTETTPSSNGKSFSMSFDFDLKVWVLNISGDSRDYVVVLNNSTGDLDLRYLLTAADPENDIEEKWQSQPYKRSVTQAPQTTQP